VSIERIQLPTRAAWLAERHKTLGASDCAAVMGRSSWQSPYSVWWHKTNPLEPEDPTVEQMVGHCLEPLVLELFNAHSGVKATATPNVVYRNSQWPWLHASTDALTLDGLPVELKTAKFDAAKTWKKTVPLAYLVQCHVQMLVLERDEAFCAVLLNDSGFAWHPVKRVPSLCDAIVKTTDSFWRHCIETRTAPWTDAHQATSEALGAQWPEVKEDKSIVEAPDELAGAGDEYDAAQAVIAEATKAKDEIANRLKALIGPKRFARLPDGTGFDWSGKPRRFTRKTKEIKVDA
jgi:putative phage-type endonuclease